MPVTVNTAHRHEADARAQRSCSHCGLTVLPADISVDSTEQFCCSGCQAAWTIIRSSGLGAYHNLPERRAYAVQSDDTDFVYLDHAAYQRTHVRVDADGLARATVQLRGVHCASCVWLIERLPLIVPGVRRVVLNVRRHVAEIEWDPQRATLSQIASTLASLGYPPHPFAEDAMTAARRRDDRTMLIHIAIAGAIAINVMLAALASYSGLSASNDRSLDLFIRWLSLGLTIPALLWPGRTFYRGAVAAIRTRTLHLDLPIAIALSAGFARGAFNTWTGSGPVYFDALTVLIFLLLVGRFIQVKWSRRANDSADLFDAVTPAVAQVIDKGGNLRSVPTASVEKGGVVRVAAGALVAADGVVIRGSSHVDRAWLTGESTPCAVSPGDDVLAGTRNMETDVDIRVTLAGRDTHVGRLMDDVQRESEQRPAAVLTANRLAGAFIGFVLVAAAGTYLFRSAMGDPLALDAAIAVLIVTCPCALAMATPLALNVAIGRATHHGALVRSGDALLILGGHGTVYLDKTGTLTEGRMAVSWWEGDPTLRELILALERDSVHPIAVALRRAWPGVESVAATDVEHVSGGGVSGNVAGQSLHVGSQAFVEGILGRPISVSDGMPIHMTPVFVSNNDRVIACIGLTDPVRRDAEASVTGLRQRGWHVQMLTGDAPGPAAAVANQSGIPAEDITCLASPADKLDAVKQAKRLGAVVVVGDGVNDSAALSASSAGIAMHGGAEVALRCADAYLTHSGLTPLITLVDAARRTQSTITVLLAASLAYNVAAIALALSGHISPLLAAILMPISSVTVIAGAWHTNPFHKRA